MQALKKLFAVYVQLMYTLSSERRPEFDWDEQNERHLANHGISRSDAEDVLSGNHILLEYQMEGNEQRWVAVGATRIGRILNIIFAVRGEAMRPITGWAADKETADLYQTVGTGINMAKAKMKQVVIPKFSIEAEIRRRMRGKKPLTLGSLLQGGRPSQPVTLRVPKEDLETARRLAARKGVGYQTYIKMLLRE